MGWFLYDNGLRHETVKENKLFAANDKVEYRIANASIKYWNGTVPRYIHEIVKLLLLRYSNRLQITLDSAQRKTNTKKEMNIVIRVKNIVKNKLKYRKCENNGSFIYSWKNEIHVLLLFSIS